jgi:hypothetical protein
VWVSLLVCYDKDVEIFRTVQGLMVMPDGNVCLLGGISGTVHCIKDYNCHVLVKPTTNKC